jgi:hypothetical protein
VGVGGGVREGCSTCDALAGTRITAPASPQSVSKLSFSRPLICTTGRRVPASSSANPGNWKRRFDPTLRAGGLVKVWAVVSFRF